MRHPRCHARLASLPPLLVLAHLLRRREAAVECCADCILAQPRADADEHELLCRITTTCRMCSCKMDV
eukprot:scaffold62596_cov54-Phaeocystis_antarctica.AAC.1